MARSSRAKKRPVGGTIDQLPSGAYRVRVEGGTDPVTKRRYRPTEIIEAGADAEAQANAALVRMLNEVNERRQPKTNATLNHLLDRHLELLKVEPSTLSRYRDILRVHVRPFVGATPAGRIDAEIIDSLYGEMRRCQAHCTTKRAIDHRTLRAHTCTSRCLPHRCRPLAEPTIRKAHYILTGAFTRAVRWDWIGRSPMDRVEPPAPSPNNPHPPTAEQAARILNAAWSRDPDWGTQVWLSMITGSRRGETCGLRWSHLDRDNQVVHMHRAIAQDGKETWEKGIKTHQDRRVVLDADTLELLDEHRERAVARAESIGLQLRRDAFIFSREPDGSVPLTPSSVTQRFRKLARSLDIDTHLNALRHYSATELIAAGVDVRTVGGRLGHHATTSLRNYVAWVSEADQRAAKSLTPRMPDRPRTVDPAERAKTDPRAPYELIAVAIRNQILNGDLQDGSPAPTLKDIVAEHGVATGTAHRAMTLLKEWGLVTGGSRGRRPVVARAGEDDDGLPEGDIGLPAPDPDEISGLMEVRLLRLGREVRQFSVELDVDDPAQLRRLLYAAVRRYAGENIDVDDYELEITREGELVTRFAALPTKV